MSPVKINLNLNVHLYMHGSAGEAEIPPATETSDRTIEDAIRLAISKMKPQRSAKTTSNYMTALRSFGRFSPAGMRLSELSESTIEAYAQWLRQEGVSPNTSSYYMRSLRTLLKDIDEQAGSLFARVFTGNARTVKRAADRDTLLSLRTLQVQPASYYALARDVFMFCFYAQGMPFVDVAHLRTSHISHGYIVYRRQKTGQRVSIRMEPCMQDIIDRYHRQDSDLVFPLIPDDKTADELAYWHSLNRYNRALKVLARRAGLDANLTSYVARHTWASEAYRQSVDLSVIAKALGHANPKTTLTYVKELDDATLANANRRLLADFEDRSDT